MSVYTVVYFDIEQIEPPMVGRQSPSFWVLRGLHGWCGSRTCCSLVMWLGQKGVSSNVDFWLNFFCLQRSGGYLNQVNIEYVKKDTYILHVESNQANLYWCKWNFTSVSRRSVWPSPWHNIVHIQLQYIYILMYPHFMDQSFVFRSLWNLDKHFEGLLLLFWGRLNLPSFLTFFFFFFRESWRV